MRLDKFLVECGFGSRTEVKSLLKAGRVSVDGKPEKSPKRQIDERESQVTLDGELLEFEHFVYYLMNKPKGVLSATEDRSQKTVLDLLDDLARKKAVFPVGRLDKDTHGLLLLTNDGKLAHALLSPKRHVEKIYQARVKGRMTEADALLFSEGIPLKDFRTKPSKLEIVSQDDSKEECLVRITLSEGKYHQVKRMVAYCGKEVVDLQRLSMGSLKLDANLKQGEWRRLTEEEVKSLQDFRITNDKD